MCEELYSSERKEQKKSAIHWFLNWFSTRTGLRQTSSTLAATQHHPARCCVGQSHASALSKCYTLHPNSLHHIIVRSPKILSLSIRDLRPDKPLNAFICHSNWTSWVMRSRPHQRTFILSLSETFITTSLLLHLQLHFILQVTGGFVSQHTGVKDWK